MKPHLLRRNCPLGTMLNSTENSCFNADTLTQKCTHARTDAYTLLNAATHIDEYTHTQRRSHRYTYTYIHVLGLPITKINIQMQSKRSNTHIMHECTWKQKAHTVTDYTHYVNRHSAHAQITHCEKKSPSLQLRVLKVCKQSVCAGRSFQCF